MLYQVVCGIFLFFSVSCISMENVKMVKTPFGEFPEDCVHVAKENDAVLTPKENGNWVDYPSGRREFHPKLSHCVEHVNKLRQSRKSVQMLTEWQDYASATMPSIMGVFTAHYTLPSANPNPSGGELLYFFIGMQDDGQPDLSIIQPVVSYCAETSKCDAGQGHFLPQGWSMMATNCCPNGQTWYGSVQPLSSGAHVDGLCSSNSSVVYITMTDATSHTTSSLSQADTQRKFNWAAVTLEQYNANECTDYNLQPFNFTGMTLTSLSGQKVTPDWKTTTGNLCAAKVVVIDAFDVSIYGTTQK